MNSLPKAVFWNGASQDVLQIIFCGIRGTRHYHRSSLQPELVWHKQSQEAGNDRTRCADAHAHIEKTQVSVSTALFLDITNQASKDMIVESNHSKYPEGRKPSRNNHTVPERVASSLDSPPQPLPLPCDSPTVSLSSSDDPVGYDTRSGNGPSVPSESDRSGRQWEVPAGGGPPIAWDPDLAAECERSTLLSAPRPPPPVPERPRQAEPAADAELRQLAGDGRLSEALYRAAVLAAAGTPPAFLTLSLLADEAARRAEPTAFERARRLAARLYPVNYGRSARLRDAQLELLWRRRLFAPACGLLLRYRAEPVRGQLMARRFAVCCCLAAREGVEDALPHIQRTAAALMDRGVSGPLLSAWQHCMLSERHSFQEAGRRLLLGHPAARRHLAPHLLHVLHEAQLAGREDVLRGLLELVLRLGEARLYPLVFGALLDFQCLMEDVRSARETFKLAGELSISLPSTVLNRYSSLLQRHRLKAPAALMRMKYRQRPPDGSAVAAKPVPPAPAWWDKW